VLLETDGHHLIGVLHLPEENGQFPAILINHGYAGSKIGSQRLYVELAQQLAESGIATLRLDFRGCGDSEGDFARVTVDDLVADALEGLAFLRSHPAVDPRRLGLLGASLGAAIAARVARKDQSMRSLALWAGVAVGRLWIEDWMRHYPDQVHENGISCGGVIAGANFRDSFLGIRADEDVKKLTSTPLFHVEGGRDRIVFSGHAQAFRTARDQSIAPSRFVVLPESDHHFSHPEERKLLLEQTTGWFVETLGE
jgi:uncharacterized protein